MPQLSFIREAPKVVIFVSFFVKNYYTLNYSAICLFVNIVMVTRCFYYFFCGVVAAGRS